jgi:hypothetical protein
VAGILGGGQPGILGGGAGQGMVGPRIPWSMDPFVTTLGVSLLGGRTLQQGLSNFSQAAPFALGARTQMQDRMIQASEKAEAKATENQQNAAFNAWVKAQSGIDLSPADIAVIEANPDMGRMLFGESLKTKFAPADPKKNLMPVDGKIYDAASGQWIAPPDAGRPDAASISNITALRKDFEDEKGTNRYRESAPILSSMIKSIGDNSAMADLDFVYGMAKIFDPTSVVRESEMGLVIEGQSVPAQIVGLFSKVASGEAVLQPESRRALVQAAQTRVQEYYNQATQEASDFTGIAEQLGIDPSLIVRPLETMPTYAPAPPASPEPAIGTVIDGFRYNGGGAWDQNNWTKVE